MNLAYISIVSHLSAKNYRNSWKFDEVLTKTNLLSFFWDTVYIKKKIVQKFAYLLEDPREPISTKFGTAGRLADLINHDNFLAIGLGISIL